MSVGDELVSSRDCIGFDFSLPVELHGIRLSFVDRCV